MPDSSHTLVDSLARIEHSLKEEKAHRINLEKELAELKAKQQAPAQHQTPSGQQQTPPPSDSDSDSIYDFDSDTIYDFESDSISDSDSIFDSDLDAEDSNEDLSPEMAAYMAHKNSPEHAAFLAHMYKHCPVTSASYWAIVDRHAEANNLIEVAQKAQKEALTIVLPQFKKVISYKGMFDDLLMEEATAQL